MGSINRERRLKNNPDNRDDTKRFRHWRLNGYFIIKDAPHPDYPTERKRCTVRPLGPVSVSDPDMCDRMLKYGDPDEEC